MPGNTFGQLLRLTTFGESHGPALGGVLDGFPPGIRIDFDAINHQMARRRPGQSALTTARQEEDEIEFLSGLDGNLTLGTPIAFIIRNKDHRPGDYAPLTTVYRPSHADFTYQKKYGVPAQTGGGRSSARETAARVAGGALAKALLTHHGVELSAYVSSVGDISMPYTGKFYGETEIDASPVRCPDPSVAKAMETLILEVKEMKDSVGGTVTCVIKNCAAGWGEPVFDKLHADLGKAILSINACKGIEFGGGFSASAKKGSENNDPFIHDEKGEIIPKKNSDGGIQGGISNGAPIWFRAAFKPPTTIGLIQETLNHRGEKVTLEATGRHDPCVLPRAVPIVEAMTALTLADHLLRQKIYSV